MSQDTMEVARAQLAAALREGFEGSPTAWRYFTDNGRGAGVFGTIGPLVAKEASRPSGPGRTTVAAHVYHLAFALDATRARIGGDRARRDGRESWRVATVDDEIWDGLRAELSRAYTDFLRMIGEADLSTPEAFGAIVGAVAHVAYHLGALRQKVGAAVAAN